MTETIIYASLISAFFAGMIALFAPCCVTYLLPSYLGSVFRQRRHVFAMTLVFALGIFLVLLPAVAGSQILSTFIFRYHTPIYLTGGAVMILAGILALLGIKLPMPGITGPKLGGRPDVPTVFTLGIVSGITSACCAPVLVGVLTLSFLAPSFYLALLIAVFYVLGMVFPLFVISFFLDKKGILTGNWLKRMVGPFPLSDLLSFLIFSTMGILVIYLTLATDFSMEEGARIVQDLAMRLQKFFTQIPLANEVFAVLVITLFATLIWKGLKGGEKQ